MPEPTTDTDRAIELEIDLAATPEEVWDAIATGPGISAWFVPTTVDGRPGGAVGQDFGPGDEMKVAGHVQAWEPPRRFRYGENPEPTEGGMAFEFLVEARDEGTCVVRLVNSGFGHGEEWDDQFDAMEQGWRIFLEILKLHVEQFPGQPAHRVQAMAGGPAPAGGPDELWSAITATFSVDGDRITTTADAPSTLSGTVRRRWDRAMAVLLDEPSPGTAFVAVEGTGAYLSASVWLSFYGAGAADAAGRAAGPWQELVGGLFPAGTGGG